jgi:hypothetical protein
MFTLEQILAHVDGNSRAALRRLHALNAYHLKACASATVDTEKDNHAAKAGHYRTLIDQLENTK